MYRHLALWSLLVCTALLGLGLANHSPAADEEDFSDELPRIPPHAPADALSTFQLHSGFTLEQAAAEPLVTDPVAMSFDARGRLYVAEMIDYSEDDKANLGLVRLLEDTDEDGKFDKATVFAETLSWPTAITCYDGGVFIGAAPHIYYAKDTDGDGKADEQRIVFTGFSRHNVQGLFNSFHWGLDNRIHGAGSSVGGLISRPDQPDEPPVNINGRDFAFDPKTLKFEAVSGGAQHGMSFDDWGRKFLSSNSDHIQLSMYEDRYVARNPQLTAPGPRISIAADGPQAEVFRISPVEPWRIVRTRLRMSGKVPGIVEGGGRAAGYFTGATGGTIYRGDAWPAEYRGQVFVGDVGSNIVHRKSLTPKGVELVANRADEGVEFLASSDIWFRPCQYSNAPDGNLYVLDVYREVIEHPASLPPPIKKHLDLTSGRGMGRIYRIVPDGYQQRALPKFDTAPTAELVAALAHPNGWHRDTAARVLWERQDKAAIGPLRKLAAESKSSLGRMHAMYVLDGMSALRVEDVLPRLSDEHPGVRQHAARLSEQFAQGDASEKLLAALMPLANDDAPLVRYQLAFTLGEFAGDKRIAGLSQIAQRDGADRWIRLAILSSLGQGAGDLFAELAGDNKFRVTADGRQFLEVLVNLIGTQNRKPDVAAVVAALQGFTSEEHDLSFALVRALGEGLAKAGAPLRETLAATDASRAGKLLDDLLGEARGLAANDNAPLEQRVEGIRTLKLDRFGEVQEILAALLDNKQPQALQLAALQTLDKFNEDAVGSMLLSAWRGYSPQLRSAATEAIFARPQRIAALLDAVESGEVANTELEPARIKLLLASSDAQIKERAGKLFSDVQLGKRQDIVVAYRPALEMEGDVVRGKAAFKKICAACHKLDGVGHEIGPNLATLQNRGAEAILLNVLDPNREVNPQFVNYVAVTNDGRSLTGMISAETATSVTLKRAESANDTVLRIDLDTLESTRQSLMPEGVEKQLDKQGMADLIAYLLTIK
ncbi:MAG: PVC-type heme-binding CxxCH protein [Pirellulales bacterium]